MIDKGSTEDRIRGLVKGVRDYYAVDGGPLRMPGMFGIPMLGSLLPMSAMPKAVQPPTRTTAPAPEKAQYLQDMPYGLAPQPMPSPTSPQPIAPMPSAMPRYQGDIMPMPDARPAQPFQPQNPKPMPKSRSPFRMDAPPGPRRRY